MGIKNISTLRIKNSILILSFLILLISFSSSNQWSTLPIGNELFWWIVEFVFIYILIYLKQFYNSPSIEKRLFYVNIYISWNIICIFRGAFVAENYWEWKFLIGTSFLLLLPLIVYLPSSLKSVQISIRTWFIYGLILFIFFYTFLVGRCSR